jgi:hypothetical protein
MSSARLGLSVGLLAAVLFLGIAQSASPQSKPTVAELLDRAVGTKTRADFIQQLGPPQQTMSADGDEFFIYSYSEAVNDPLVLLGNGLSNGAAGYRGQPPIPLPSVQRQIILRFNGQTGLLKGWNNR